MIVVSSVTFAESIRVGARNLELMSIDTEREEYKNFFLLLNEERNLLYIIDRDPKLTLSEQMMRRRYNSTGMPNVRCMRQDRLPTDVEDFLISLNKENTEKKGKK